MGEDEEDEDDPISGDDLFVNRLLLYKIFSFRKILPLSSMCPLNAILVYVSIKIVLYNVICLQIHKIKFKI